DVGRVDDVPVALDLTGFGLYVRTGLPSSRGLKCAGTRRTSVPDLGDAPAVAQQPLTIPASAGSGQNPPSRATRPRRARDVTGRVTAPTRAGKGSLLRSGHDRNTPRRRTCRVRLAHRMGPRGPGLLGVHRPPGGPPQPDLLDRRRAPRLLRLGAVER